MRSYKDNLSYDPKWKKQYPWIEYNSCFNGMGVFNLYILWQSSCTKAKGAWVTRPVCNWVKAISLSAKHDKSEWHKAALEKQKLSLLTEKHGNVAQQITSVTEEDSRHNRDVIKKLIRSLYFLMKHYIPHTTTFEGLVALQIENGNLELRDHRDNSPRNATYQSYATIVDLLSSISKILERNLCQA